MNFDHVDAGIRKTVTVLNEAGYHTTDSGDGTGPGSTPREWEKLRYGHVVIVPVMNSTAVADSLAAFIRTRFGLVPVPQSITDPEKEEVIVEFSYNPTEGVCFMTVSHILDKDWI